MRNILLEIKDNNFLSPLQQPHNYFPNQTPQQFSSSMNLESSNFNLNNKVSPTILLIIIILSIVFFISGLLHLLVRFLWRPRNSRFPDELETVTALQGQLQQLFNLHDSGVDQTFIDTLPVFDYKSIIGLKDPFDCAVCLCEFEGQDKLRLLPKCSHAFHMDCIDTWLLSHSTCPLCRDSLLIDFPNSRNSSPLVFVLESRSNEISREIVQESDCNHTNNEVGSRVNSQLSNEQFMRMPFSSFLEKSSEIEQMEDEIAQPPSPSAARPEVVANVEKVVVVKLGKYRNNVDCVGEGSSSSTNSIDSRRCFSMGSFAYVMNENASLQVSIKPFVKKQSIKKHDLHRGAKSECGFDSRREFNGFDPSKVLEQSSSEIKGTKGIQRESFSFSKTWLRGKIDRPNSAKVESERRAFSFRLPRQQVPMPLKRQPPKRGKGWSDSMQPYPSDNRETISEIGFDKWEMNNGLSEMGCDDEVHSCNSLDSQVAHAPSFARRTLLWVMGRPNKVVHSDSSSNV